MADELIDLGNGCWNVRGTFKIGGLLNIGTQCSLIQRSNGDFVFLDSDTLNPVILRQVYDLTDEGRKVTAILNLHPFHTIHVRAAHEQFPGAALYGTSRHKAKAPDLPWAEPLTDQPDCHALFAPDLRFTVPPGVHLIPSNENLHFASVLAFHPASQSLHVDDTLTFSTLPLIGGLSFHLTLKRVLKEEAGAVAAFRAWAEQLATDCDEVTNLCTAHMKTLPPTGQPYGDAVRQALKKVESVLRAHETRWG